MVIQPTKGMKMPRRGNDNLDSLLTAQYGPTTTCYRCPVHSTQYPRGSLGVVWEGEGRGGICTHAMPTNSSCLRRSPILSRRGFFRQGPDSEPSTNLSSACPGRARISGDTPLLEQYVVEASDKQKFIGLGRSEPERPVCGFALSSYSYVLRTTSVLL